MDKALNSNPRKLHYNSVVSFLQYNRPSKFRDDQEGFLYSCFDAEGKFSKAAIVWLLFQFGILKVAEGQVLDEEVLFPPLDEDTIRASRERIMSGQNIDNSPLAKSTGSLNVDELRSSMEAIAHHVCGGHGE